jgi:hypothetical protein
MSKGIQKIQTYDDIEYAIYTFDYDYSSQNLPMRWKKYETLMDLSKAIKKAERLYNSGNYIKVEVKQKHFDFKRKRKIDKLLRVFEDNKEQHLDSLAILGFALLCGIVAFGLVYFFS